MKPKDNLLRTINHAGYRWVPNGMENVVTITPPVTERRYSGGPDAFGVNWILNTEMEGDTYPAAGDYVLKDIAEWRSQVTFPDVDSLDWESIARQVASIDRDNYLVQGFIEMGLFERSYLLMGMENALIAYMINPEAMVELLSAIADYKIKLITKFHEVAHLDLVWYGDDWGQQNNLFLPADTWRAVIKPHTKRIYDCLKTLGIIINQHSCGKIESIVGDLVDMGMNIWNPCQPCNDLAGLKREFGHRMTFCGGIDSQFVLNRPGVQPDEVRSEVRRRIDELAEGGGYIAAPSHSVPYEQAVLDAMNDEIEQCGSVLYCARTTTA